MGFFSEYNEVSKLLKEKQSIVFYAESRHYYPYFEKLISDLLQHTDLSISYVTSDKNDPLLQQAPAGMRVTYCKWMLGYFFKQVRADVMIMTMTDLGNYFFKRSATVGKYVYVFHAAVSTHLQYRKHAFDNYDIILCTGEYQQREIRSAEGLYKLPAKELISYGYPLIQKLQEKAGEPSVKTHPVVLVAPSWFEGCVFETCIEDLLQELSKLPYATLLRSHPEYQKRYPARFRKIRKMMQAYPNMSIDENPDVVESLVMADLLITDRSGIAFEYAFGIGKPVLFIETALKETNPDWKEIGIEPVENQYRNLMGISVLPSELELLPGKLEELKGLATGFLDNIRQTGEALFYNWEGQDPDGADRVRQLIVKG